MPFVHPEADVVLRSWLFASGGERCADLVAALPLEHHATRVEVAATLLDCVIRRILPVSERYRDGWAELAALPSIAEPASRPTAMSPLRAMRPPSPSAPRRK